MQKRIVLAADELSVEQLLPLLKRVASRLYAVKIHDLYDEHGPQIVGWLKNYDVKVWVDAKLHDIPATVARRATAFKKAGADILSVHASGHVDMMMEAVAFGPEEIFAITVLTSLNETKTKSVYARSVQETVSDLAQMAGFFNGIKGIVCSPNELAYLKGHEDLDPHMKFVTPGIRSLGKDAHDQQRIATPGQAILNGSSLLVIGRQITQSKDPLHEIELIEAEIEQALLQKGVWS
ncbi:MAG: orotidine-5'-phosphate decarboxylase [Candidatus Uhrbacteria bacterium]|nr:orotidine-5'-phosphate decarboxylase [Candidatus Uhrbacteria bacterium]